MDLRELWCTLLEDCLTYLNSICFTFQQISVQMGVKRISDEAYSWIRNKQVPPSAHCATTYPLTQNSVLRYACYYQLLLLLILLLSSSSSSSSSYSHIHTRTHTQARWHACYNERPFVAQFPYNKNIWGNETVN